MACTCRTSLHFIRCIKPNSQQVAAHFDPQLILHQLKCCGVLEVTRIARAGYPTRYRHEQFAARYKVLLPELGSGEGIPWLGFAGLHNGCLGMPPYCAGNASMPCR